MRKLSARLIIAFAVLGVHAAVLAAPARAPESAFSLFTEGAYGNAILAGETEGGPQGYALAAAAAIADAELRETPCLECLIRAEELARLAIDADPENAEAYILFVTAIGRRARLIGFFSARRERIADQTEEAISTALELNPSSAFAHSLRGAWHIEVVRLAGGLLARVLYDARAEEGRSYFAEAIALEPNNVAIRYQYALILEGYDFAAERSEIEASLEAAVAGMPRNAYEEALRARAQILLDLLRGGMEDAFHEHARNFRGDG